MKNRVIYWLSIGLLVIITFHIISLLELRGANGHITIESEILVITLHSSPTNELQQNHTLSRPIIISPEEGDIVNGTVRIEWTEAIDSEGHSVWYTVSHSQHGDIYDAFPDGSDIQTTYYNWDTRSTKWCDYYIKVDARSSEGLTSESIPIWLKVQNEPPELKFLLSIILIIVIIIILVSLILYRRKKISSYATGGKILYKMKTAAIGLCLGSFTDKGLIIKGINSNCPFSPSQIQSLLEYSAALYQHGKIKTMYGPIPLASLREIEIPTEPSQTEWSLISYWTNIKDSTVKDSRITKIGGTVPAALLLFYPKQHDQVVMVNKNNIINILNSIIDKIHDISYFSDDLLNQIEKQLLKLLVS